MTGWFDFKGLLEGAFPHDALMQLIYTHRVLPKSARWKAHRVFYMEASKSSLAYDINPVVRVARDISAGIGYAGLLIGHDIAHKAFP